MSFARFYPLGPDCNALCAEARQASDILGVVASLGHTVFDTAYDTHTEADKASRSHPAFLSYLAQIEALQDRHGVRGSTPYRSAYGAPTFGFEASEDGIQLFVKHWRAAPDYPLGHDLVDIMRLGVSRASRSSIPALHGPAGPLRTLVLKPGFKGAHLVLDRFGEDGPLRRTPEAIYLRYFPLKAPSPVVRRANGTLDILGYARTAAEARQFTQNTPQFETVSLSDRFQSAEDAIAVATRIFYPRWFDVVSDTMGGTHCVASVWMERPKTVSKCGAGMAGGGGAARSVPFYHCPALSELKGSDRFQAVPIGAELETVSGEPDLLTRGKGT